MKKNKILFIALLAVLCFFVSVSSASAYDVYQELGSTNTPYTTGTSWATVPEMTRTLSVNAGEKLIILHSGNYYTATSQEARLRIDVEGVAVSGIYNVATDESSSSSTYHRNLELIAVYNVTETATITIDVKWRNDYSGNRITAYNTHRALTIIRFNSTESDNIEIYSDYETATDNTITNVYSKADNIEKLVSAEAGDILWVNYYGNYYLSVDFTGFVALAVDGTQLDNGYEKTYAHESNSGSTSRTNFISINSFYNVTESGTFNVTALHKKENNVDDCFAQERELVIVKFRNGWFKSGYDYVNTGGSINIATGSYNILDEFNHTVTCDAGDRMFIVFDTSVFHSPYCYTYFRIKVDGTVALDTRQTSSNWMSGADSTPPVTTELPMKISAVYTAVTSKSYDIWVEAYGQAGYTHRIENASAKMSVYVMGGEYELPIVFTPLNTSIVRGSMKFYDSSGNELTNGSWLYMSEVYSFQVDVYNPAYTELNFSDTQRNIELSYTNWLTLVREKFSANAENDPYVISLVSENSTILSETEVTTLSQGSTVLATNTSRLVRLKWVFILSKNIVDSEYVWFNISSISDVNQWYTNSTDYDEIPQFIYLHIYNLGGFVDYSYTDGAGRLQGGDSFEIYARAILSNATASTMFRKLQHVHMLVEVGYNLTWNGITGRYENTLGLDSGNYQFTMDYELNGVWVKGWKIKLKPVQYQVGHQNAGVDLDYVKFQVDFYQWNGTDWDLKKTDYSTTNCWAYDNENALVTHYDDRIASQFWVDMWFNKMNSSTVVGARVTPYYYGMYEQGSSWWFGYGAFRPTFGNETAVSFFTNLLDENQTVTNCYGIENVNFTVGVYKTGLVHRVWKLQNYEVLDFKLADDRMEGIDTPPIVEVKVLDMPQGGFVSPLIKAIESLGGIIWNGAFRFMRLILTSLDTVFMWLGFPEGFFSGLMVYLVSLGEIIDVLISNAGVSITNLVYVISDIMLLVITIIPRWVMSIDLLVGTMIRWFILIVGFLTGNVDGIEFMNMWAELDMWTWVNVGFALLPVWWFNRVAMSDDPVQTSYNDGKAFISFTIGLVDFLMKIIDSLNQIIASILGAV